MTALEELRKLGPHIMGEPQRRSRRRAALEIQLTPAELPPHLKVRPKSKRALTYWHAKLYAWLAMPPSEQPIAGDRSKLSRLKAMGPHCFGEPRWRTKARANLFQPKGFPAADCPLGAPPTASQPNARSAWMKQFWEWIEALG
jgi:hypothetical protein